MSEYKVSVEGINQLIEKIQQGNPAAEQQFAKLVAELLSDSLVEGAIAGAAGEAHKHKISLSIKTLVEDVRQDAIMLCLTRARTDWILKSDAKSASFILNHLLRTAAASTVDDHLGTRRKKDGSRTKDLAETPFKWEAQEGGNTRSENFLRKAESRAATPGSTDLDRLSESALGKLEQHDPDLARLYVGLRDGHSRTEMAKILEVTPRTITNRFEKMKEWFARNEANL